MEHFLLSTLTRAFSHLLRPPRRQITDDTQSASQQHGSKDSNDRTRYSATTRTISGLTTIINGGKLAKSLEELIEQSKELQMLINTFKLNTIAPHCLVFVDVLFTIAKDQIELDQNVNEIFTLMLEILSFITSVDHLPEKIPYLEANLIRFLEQATEFCCFVQHYCRPSFLKRMFGSNSQKVNHFKARFVDLKDAIAHGTILQTSFVSARLSEMVDVMSLRKELDPVKMDASNRPMCLPGTRIDSIKEIYLWLFSETKENILWLHGPAGCGKSAISMSISENLFRMRRCGAYLFFECGKSDPGSVIRTIAFWLASFDKAIRDCLVDAVGSNSGIAFASLNTQFEKLLLGPLNHASSSITGSVVIILDGLDECGTYDTRGPLLSIIKREFPKIPPAFRFLITSRPVPDLLWALTGELVHHIDLSHSTSSNRSDVSQYIEHELLSVFEKAEVRIPIDRWREKVGPLDQMASDFFLWASLAIKYVQSCRDDPVSALENLLFYCRSGDIASCPYIQRTLTDLYDSVLRNSGIAWDSHRKKEHFSRILGLILCFKKPLSIDFIDRILGVSGQSSSWYTIRLLQSVLVCSLQGPNGTVEIFHTSFSDYLLMVSDRPWSVPSRLSLIHQCFDIMQKGLQFNICGLKSSFITNDQVEGIESTIKNKVSAELEYACQIWAELLCDIPHSPDSAELLDRVDIFAKSHLLHWFEVLSLTKHFGNVACRALAEAMKWTKGASGELSSFLEDAYRLAYDFSLPISQTIPHIYLSMLSFSKGKSIVCNHYSRVYPVLQVGNIKTSLPFQCTRIFTGHTSGVSSVAHSWDGDLIASGSCDDNTIFSWGAKSGDIVSGPTKTTEYDSWVTSVAFSPDLKCVASGLGNGSVLVWNLTTGEHISMMTGHSDWVRCISFSPDGTQIASGSDDHTVCVWDVDSGRLISGPFEGHENWVRSVCFSSDGRWVASGSDDMTVRMWDAQGDLIYGPFGRPYRRIMSICLSPDGKQIAAGSEDTVCIWDAESGELNPGPLTGHHGNVRTVSFSPNGKQVAAGSDDKTVRIWSSESGQLLFGPLRSHNDSVTSISFSPDSKQLASGSEDNTICIWELDHNHNISCPQEWGVVQIKYLAFALGGISIAFCTGEDTIYVWDAKHSGSISRMRGAKRGTIVAITFSSDGKLIASAWFDHTVLVWNTESGKVNVCPPMASSIHSMAFLSDGERIAIACRSPEIMIWSITSTGMNPIQCADDVRECWEDHSCTKILLVSFSPDLKRLMSVSCERMRSGWIWATEDGRTVTDLVGRIGDGIVSASFSPDSSRIVTGSEDFGVRVWDADSGNLIAGPFEGHIAPVLAVSFSPDGKRVVSSSGDHILHVWILEHDQSSATLAAEDGDEQEAHSCQIVSNDGWLLGKNGDLLVWLPEDMRPARFVPSESPGFVLDLSTKVELTGGRIGEGWYKGYGGIN